MGLFLRNTRQSLKGFGTRILKRVAGPYSRRLRWLEETQWYSKEQLEQLQLRLLRDIVNHAYDTVPYYHRLMDELKIRPEDISHLEDIRRFPILTKDQIRAAGNSLHSTKYPSFLTKTAHTGGTTGQRVALKRDIWSIGNEHAFVRRQYQWAGVTTGDVCGYLSWRIVCPPGQQPRYPYVYDRGMRELILSTFHLSFQNAGMYMEAIKQYRVRALVGYPSAISILARHCLAENTAWPLQAVLTTSETLDPARREQISKAFCCPVYDNYGGSERVCYIHSCREGSYHILSEYGVTELIEIADRPQYRKVIATGFWNRAMPLIRYDTGDLVVPRDTPCSCGRQYPCVDRIIGRENSVITTPSGRVFGPTIVECIMEFILHDLKSLPIVEAQMVLEQNFRLVLEYVSLRDLEPSEEKAIGELVAYHIPSDFSFQCERVCQIRKTVSGKALSLALR
jgi:phenylacetate-CoA ligase